MFKFLKRKKLEEIFIRTQELKEGDMIKRLGVYYEVLYCNVQDEKVGVTLGPITPFGVSEPEYWIDEFFLGEVWVVAWRKR